MVSTLPTSVHTCMREDWNGYTAARLSSESANIVKISILHSMKLYDGCIDNEIPTHGYVVLRETAQ